MSAERFYNGEDVSAVILDLGSFSIRAGYGGLYENPQFEFPALSGIVDNSTDETIKSRYRFGDVQLSSLPPDALCESFIKNGKVTDWDLFENFIDFFFDKQQIEAAEIPVFFVENPEFEIKHREKLAEIMFERFKVPAISVFPNSPLVTLYKDKPQGTVVDFGSSQITSSCVSNIFLLRNSVRMSELGGNFFAAKAYKHFKDKNLELTGGVTKNENYNKFLINKMLHEQGIQMFNFKSDDGKDVAEMLFDRRLNGRKRKNLISVENLISASLQAVDCDIRCLIAKTVVTTGGMTHMADLISEIKNIKYGRFRPTVNGNIITLKDPSWDAWKGASIMVGTGSFSQQWYSMEQYKSGNHKMLFYY